MPDSQSPTPPPFQPSIMGRGNAAFPHSESSVYGSHQYSSYHGENLSKHYIVSDSMSQRLNMDNILEDKSIQTLKTNDSSFPKLGVTSYDCTTQQTQISLNDCNALTAIYNSTGGSAWTTSTGWMAGDKPCDWYGISCADVGGTLRITGLELPGNGLTGALPTEISLLTSLVTLNLGFGETYDPNHLNYLSGAFPDLSGMLNLETLDLGVNGFDAGPLPAYMVNFTNLKILRLEGNNLTGDIPSGIGALPNLEKLALDYNSLSGIIPSFSNANLQLLWLGGNQFNGEIPTSIAALTGLVEVFLGGNKLTGGVPDLSGSIGLQNIDVSYNQLSGSLPTWWTNMPNLEYVNFDNNQFTGSIPTDLSNLAPHLKGLGLGPGLIGSIPDLSASTQLEYLILPEDSLTGEIPSYLGTLPNLIVLDLGGNQLSGEIPANFSNLTHMERLLLKQNDLTGALPDLSASTGLLHLDVFQNQLSGPFPGWVTGLTHLEGLWLQENQFTGEIPAGISALTGLKGLGLGSGLTGTIPDLSGATQLEELWIYGNQLSGGIPVWLGSLTKLRELGLQENHLSGEIPANFSDLTHLERLVLGKNDLSGALPDLSLAIGLINLEFNSNHLSGSFPAWTANLTNLISLQLGGNQFSGEIPAGFSSLTHLEGLGLWGNQLTGSIPDLSMAIGLKYLDVWGNQLSGPLPTWWTNMSNLEYVNFSDNQFTGSIPSDLSSLTPHLKGLGLGPGLSGSFPDLSTAAQLEYLYLMGNGLTGEIPVYLGTFSNLIDLDLGGNQLSGEIPVNFSDLTHLENLLLKQNELSGSLPDLSASTGLINLDVTQNQLSGPFPNWVTGLTHLEGLWLQENQFTGEIPSGISTLTKLWGLGLGSGLTGTIPDLSGATQLEELWIYGNQLSGGIPVWLGSLTKLRGLGLGGNQLSGGIPPNFSNLIHLERLALSNNKLSGEIPTNIINLVNIPDAVGTNHNLDLGNNRLFSANSVVRSYLSKKDPDWESTQLKTCYTLTKIASPLVGGTITASPAYSTGCASGKYKEGQIITFTSAPKLYYHFDRWVGGINVTTNKLTMPAKVTAVYGYFGSNLRRGTYNDTYTVGIDHTSAWLTQTGALYYGITQHYTRTKSSTVTVNFTGTRMAMYYTAGRTNGKVTIQVDNRALVVLNEYASATTYKKLWWSVVLPNANHKVVITYYTGNAVNATVNFDGVIIQ
ncbi:MAG: hypothetical protein WCI88_07840 [Chloroflexota bacterium]